MVCEEDGVGVEVEEGGGEMGIDLGGEQALELGSFVGTGGEKEDLAGLEDVGEAEGEAVGGGRICVTEHGVLEGSGGEFGDVGVGRERVGGFVESQVAVDAEPEDAEVDWAILMNHFVDARGFDGRVGGVAVEGEEAVGGDAKGTNKMLKKIGFAGGGVVHGQAAPFVEFENAEMGKKRGICRGRFGQQAIGARGCGAGGGSEEKAGVLAEGVKDEGGGSAGEGFGVGFDETIHESSVSSRRRRDSQMWID